MANTSLLQDAGEVVPYARKHLVASQEQRATGAITLADIWPEPDWLAMVQAGHSRELVARKFIGYQSIRNRPRAAGIRGFTAERWQEAYRAAVAILRRMYEEANEVVELSKVSDRLREVLQLSKADCHPVAERNIVYWAAGFGGERTLKGPGPATVRLSAMAIWLWKLGWPESDAAWKTSIVPVQLQGDLTWRVSQVEGDVYKFIVDTAYPDEASVLEAAREAAIAKAREVSGSTKLIPRRPRAASSVERIGPDHRNGADITPDELMKAFGLRAIQFGTTAN